MKLRFIYIILLMIISSYSQLLATSVKKTKLEKVTLQLHWKYQFEFAGFIAAKEKGFYKELGLNVELKEKTRGMDVVKELISKKVTYTLSDASFITQKAQGKPLVLLANYYKQSPQVIVTQQNILSPYNLEDKTIMASSSTFKKGSINAMMKKLKIDTNKIKTIPHTYKIQKFLNSEVDAMTIYITDQLYELHKAKKLFNIFNPSIYGITSSAVNLITTKDELKNNKTRVEKFIKASNKGWKYALDNKQEIIDIIYNKYSKRKTKKALLSEAKEVERLMLPSIYPIGSIEKSIFNPIISNLKTDKIIPDSFDFDNMIYQRKQIHYDKNLNLTKKEIGWLYENPTIKISNEDDWPPFDFSKNGKAKGYSVDLIRNLAKKIGIKIKFINGYTWNELVKQFENGKIDMMHVFPKTADREKKFNFSKPYMDWKLSYIVRDNEKNINSPKDFSGKKIAAGKGWASTKVLKRKYPKAIVVEYDSNVDMLKALAFGKVDVVIDNISSATYTMTQELLTNLKSGGYIDLSEDESDDNFYFASQKNAPQLVSIFSKALNLLTIEEKINLQKKWFGKAIDNGINRLDIDLTSQEKAWIKSNPKIIVGGEMDWAPFNFVDSNGKFVGVVADYLELIKKRTGLNLEIFTGVSYAELHKMMKDGKLDILPAVYYEKERDKYAVLTTSYMNLNEFVYVREESTIHSFDDLENKTMVIPDGYATIKLIKKHYPKINIVTTDTIQKALEMVLAKKADATMDSQIAIQYLLEENLMSGLRGFSNSLSSNPLYMLIRKEKPFLVSIISKALSSISKKEKKEILSNWISLQKKEKK